ncbi:U6 snRNA-associated Sm-like protein LSm1 isoform X2 [Loxodonta africana]|nr:U6 snRNA-associated Sm-like protein LSm1 isoform X2 [Loxodonta africana]
MSCDHTTAPPLPEDGRVMPEVGVVIWRRFRQAPAAESRGGSAVRGRVPVPVPPRRRLQQEKGGVGLAGPLPLYITTLSQLKMNYMPGTASLIEDIDTNLVLHQTVERIHVGKKYGDIPRGIFVVRGENVVLLGEIDLEKESDTPLQQVSIEEILEEQRVEQQTKLEAEKLKVQALKDRGLSIPRADTLDEY